VNDIMGGMFGAIGALAALAQRHQTGKGQEVQSALFENNVMLVAQHMMQFAVTGKAAAPMPSRISAWAVYDVFTVKENAQIFLAAVSDTQWHEMCDAFGFADLKADARLSSNNARVKARDWMLPILRERFAQLSASELSTRFEAAGLPYAPITQPQELFEDAHLLATGGLTPVTIPADASSAGQPVHTHTPLLPLRMNGERLPLRHAPPSIGQDTEALLQEMGYSPTQIQRLAQDGVVSAVKPLPV
jgi:crotonobetainyl-CoA:carnitine CoA-transferase CaiB-like acyl-CoA transferase